jgi:hypothetical protein
LVLRRIVVRPPYHDPPQKSDFIRFKSGFIANEISAQKCPVLPEIVIFDSYGLGLQYESIVLDPCEK